MTLRLASLSTLPALLAGAMLLAACDSFDGNGLRSPDDTDATLALVDLNLDFTFSQPIGIAHAGDGSGRLFIIERAGVVHVIEDGEVADTPYLDLTDRALSNASERGLLGIAFPSGFDDDGHFYVHYTSEPGNDFGINIAAGDTIVSRIHVNDGIPDRDSEELVLHVTQTLANHNGGQIAFGPVDGYLYIALGDGGGGGDPDGNGQDLGTLLGSILRIDVEAGVESYATPPDNPFVDDVNARDEIWAFGLRNPWRFSFDRETGDLYIADVGQNAYEEINFQPAASDGGENYGWNIMEATRCFPANVDCDPTGLTLPVAEYPISGAADCAVTGGYVYRGDAFPALQGIYVYGDFCSGRIRGFEVDPSGDVEPRLLLDSGLQVSTFGEDESGEILLADYATGRLHRLLPGP